ncbi:uncharacterized protein MELLADRAFT_123910 [Melampsora larici-populina 98AG31]|uniref:Secreted protein n=1 Tax=Melampsora larici-populina (strain 98AG31 / pathotype 3-4-7) TaxID=747676 RepID=F4R5A7_MELLP|nr:uncharacterized protein MELLADRAFT_123910 [Melampsora larici-populina 98AG31]EGG12295.1 secreted protein [Melampsora larici-populina 98AG31]
MKNLLSLLIVLQTLLIFGQVNSHDKLSVRSSTSDKVSLTSLVKRKNKDSNEQGSNALMTRQQTETPMNCFVNQQDRKLGYASHCYTAIALLYDQTKGYPACAIFKSCAVQPLDNNQAPMGGRTDNQGQPLPLPMTLPQMNKAYDTIFSIVAEGIPNCENYQLPNNVNVDPKYVLEPKSMFPTFLIGVASKQGQGDVAEACNPTLAAKMIKEAM